MDELKSIAKVNYTFLDKKSKIYTNEVTTSFYKDVINLVYNIYIPTNLPGIFEIDYVELLNYDMMVKSSKTHKDKTVLKLNFGINCSYKNVFFYNQQYIKNFNHDFIINSIVDVKKSSASILKYNKLTERLVRLNLKVNF